MCADSFEVFFDGGLPGTALGGACAATGKGKKHCVIWARQGSEPHTWEGPQSILKTNHVPFLPHFIDEKTETQRKGLSDLHVTLKQADARQDCSVGFRVPPV